MYHERSAEERIGFLATILGVGVTLTYAGAVVTGSESYVGVPESTYPPIIFLSVVFGPVLLTWGWFAQKDGSVQPLTLKRSLGAPVAATIGSVVGLAAYVLRWLRVTPLTFPSDTGGQPRTLDPSIVEIVQWEGPGAHLLAIAAASAMLAGTATARHGRSGLLGVLLPVALAALTLPLPVHSDPVILPILVVFGFVPFVVGYLGTAPD